MRDRFGRTIDYLRISVTDRCNLRCHYCAPTQDATRLPHEAILSFEEIADVVRIATDMGIRKVRLTGGEPLVRRGIEDLTRMLASVPGIEDLAMTTNGILLAEHADGLARAGLRRVNVSLDTMRPDRFAALTCGGEIARVLEGIDAALEAGLSPVKINCVITDSPDEEDARAVSAFARDKGLEARFIRKMDLANGVFSVVEGGSGGDCGRCNRLRLSSDGIVRPCLFSDTGFSVRELGARNALAMGVSNKPETGQSCAPDGRLMRSGGIGAIGG